MTLSAWGQLVVFFGVLLAAAWPLGKYLARVYQGQPCGLDRILGWLEQLLYRLSGVQPQEEMTWRTYAVTLLLFNGIGWLFLYGLLRLQGMLPLNSQQFPALHPHLAFNTAISFVTNTNWQNYGGETTLSYLSQMLGLAVQNFLSAATGLTVLVALIRGLVRRSAQTIGNFWVDLVRSTLYVLLPLSLLLALLLVSQGVIQNFQPYQKVALLQPQKEQAEQTLPMGPVASQVAIKQLGTNGGGFFNANGAHPYENPTPLSNFLEMLALLLLPAASCFLFGEMVGDRRQGWALLAAMLLLLVPLAVAAILAEQAGVPALAKMGVDLAPSSYQSGGQMEGKETRFGIAGSALFAAVTTATSCGAVNAMHDSFTPLGGLVPLWLMQLGEVAFGGVGSGLYGMLMFVLVAVFVAGLLVGRTPEYLGKKIQAYEMKMASLAILIMPFVVLLGTAIAVLGPGLEYVAENGEVKSCLNNPGAHGFSEVLYAFTSATNNNGSAFAGLSGDNPFYNIALGIAMFIGRFGVIIPVLAVAGSLARKKYTPPGAGTLATHTPLFVLFLVGTILLVGALNFVPALALGPLVEHLQMVMP
jgi:K+-transporting ATPase ATPase A chain